MTNILPIETEYKGIVYRSRLEARWAIFFDEMNIEYQYEPGSFQVPFNGYTLKYFPDFVLTNVKCNTEIQQPIYIEVKGRERYADIYENDRRKFESFAKDHSLLVLGSLPFRVADLFQKPDYICNFFLINGQNMPCFFKKYNGDPWLVDGYRASTDCRQTDDALYIANKACFEPSGDAYGR